MNTASLSIAPISTTRLRASALPITAVRVRPLRASQVRAVAAAEIEWFHTTHETDAASVHARALIGEWIATLDDSEQEALALRHDPLPEPTFIRRHCGGSFALAVRLATTSRWRPDGRPRLGAERAVSGQLVNAVKHHGSGVLRGLARRADWTFAGALRAYAEARGRVPSVVPVRNH